MVRIGRRRFDSSEYKGHFTCNQETRGREGTATQDHKELLSSIQRAN